MAALGRERLPGQDAAAASPRVATPRSSRRPGRPPRSGSLGGRLAPRPGARAPGEELAEVTNAPHTLKAPAVEYTVAIPTLGRWRPACVVNPSERSLKNVTRPFIIEKTLSFLGRHGVSKRRVYLFVADAEEAEHYKRALERTPWEGTHVVVGVRGIMAQRNFIVRHFPPGTYVVSIDDDISNIFWKRLPGHAPEALAPLPDGSLEYLVFDAYWRMKTYRAFICGLNNTCSSNYFNMHVDGISTRNGEVNGFLYFFINRHAEELLPRVADATEDAERSLRYFRKDNCVLRYRMYCGETRCFQNLGGLQSLYGQWGESAAAVNARRKVAERAAALRLHDLFPELTGKPREKKHVRTLEITFLHRGGAPIPATTAAEFGINHQAELREAELRAAELRQEASPGATAPPRRRVRMKTRPKAAAGQAVTPPGRRRLPRAPRPTMDGAPAKGSRSGKRRAGGRRGAGRRGPAPVVEISSGSDTWSESASCSSDSDMAREDLELLDAIRRSKSSAGVPVDLEAEAAAGQVSSAPQEAFVVQAVLRSINGDVADPQVLAIEDSSEKLRRGSATQDAQKIAEVLGASVEECMRVLCESGGRDTSETLMLKEGFDDNGRLCASSSSAGSTNKASHIHRSTAGNAGTLAIRATPSCIPWEVSQLADATGLPLRDCQAALAAHHGCTADAAAYLLGLELVGELSVKRARLKEHC